MLTIVLLNIELIYDLDCPNVNQARAQLLRAFAEAGMEPRWSEWNREASDIPPHAARYGSPTILVGGKDVFGAPPSSESASASCRLYPGGEGRMQKVPPVEKIVAAIRSAESIREEKNK